MRTPDRPAAKPLSGLVDLRRSHLSRSQLARAELQFSNLARARMRAIHLEASTLIRTDLRQANLQGAFLTGANLHEAYLEPAHGRPVNTRWTDGLIEDVGPEPGPNAHVVYWSSVEEQP